MKRLLVLLIGLMPFAGLKATHLLGGELTWSCATGSNAGKYIFELRLYRQCGQTATLGAFQTVTGPLGSISMNRVSQTDVSPKCYNNGLGPDCYDNLRATNAIEEHIYESSAITLTGTIPVAGWEFYWTSCCRPSGTTTSALVDNLSPQNQSYRLWAKMYPYTPPGASASLTANVCHDNSPVFSTAPATVICTGYPFTYNHNAKDADLDSLSYAWTWPRLSTGGSVTYATNTNTSQVSPRAFGGGFIVPTPGFSYTVPLPWAAPPNLSANNVPASINSKTGEINYTSFDGGHFVTAIKVSEYRCQQLIGEISRDIPVFLQACPPPAGFPANVPPNVVFKDSNNNYIPIPAVDTVLAGTFITFNVESTDFQFLYNPIRAQKNRLIPDGTQFGANFSDPNNGCPYLPCAVLDTSLNFIDTAGYWEAEFGIATWFEWQTSCNHIADVGDCFVNEGVYTFVFKVLDNYCPLPGANFVTYTIVVIAPDDLAAPKLTCTKVETNGDVVLNWTQPVSAAEDTLNSFRSYVLWRSIHPDSPAVAVDTIWNINTTTYTDPGVYPSTNTYYYHIMGVSSCNDQSKKIWSDTVAAMHMDVTPYLGTSAAILNWSEFAPKGWPDKAIPQYDLYEIIGLDTNFLKSTTDTIDTLFITSCFPTAITYYVEVVDTTATWGCASVSELGSGVFGDNLAPDPNFTHTVTKDPITDDLEILFYPTTDVVIADYYIYDGNLNLVATVPFPDTVYNFGPTVGNTGPETYSVSATDTCGNAGNPGPAHTTAFLQVSGKDTCSISKMISLTWSQYAYSTNIDYQEIWADTGTGWYKVDSVGPLATTYDDVSIVGPRNYRYQLRTYFNGERSISNFVSVYVAKIIDGTLIDPPVINCVSVLTNGDIRIEWTKPTNNTKNSFDSYHIYHSEDGIAFNVIDSIKGFVPGDNLAFDTTGYTHTGVYCETDHYYRVESRSGCFGRNYSAPSNTIQAMCLEANEVNEKVNDISWTPIFAGAPPSSLDANYTVWKEYPVGTTPAILRSIPFGTNATTDTIITCDDSARYYVTINDVTKGCTSVSSIDAGYYYDDVPPVTQMVDSVSVIEDSIAVIGWSPNTSIDVGGYYILRQLPQGLFQILDTITTLVPPLTYEDRDNVLDGVACYTVSAFDNCGNDVLLEEDFDYHCNIEPETKLNECDGLINVTWNAYADFTSGTNVVYQVYLSVNNGNYELLATTTARNYVYNDPVNGNNYRFYIRAVENGGAGPFASTSLKSDQEVDIPPRPEYAYLRNVTVSDSNSIRVELWIDLNGSIGEYWVGRSINGDSTTFQIVSTIEVPDPLTPADSMFRFEDTKVEANVHSYFYKIDVMDKCKDPAIISNVARSMKLIVSADRGKNENELTWNRYEGYNGGVREYRIYRGTDNTQPILVRTLPEESVSSFGEFITYRDDVSDITDDNKGQFCYYVEAVEGFPFFGNLDEGISRSNEVCAVQYPLFYVPTAFTPNGDGINDTFKPSGVFFDYDEYKMVVYNRWGEEIFTSEDINVGWDGTYEDREMLTGGYVYHIIFKSADGEEFEQKGTIIMTR